MSDKKQNYYDVLGVENDATAEEIKIAFRRRAMETHPDRNHGDDAAFKEVNEANETLSNPVKRKVYDASGTFTAARTVKVDDAPSKTLAHNVSNFFRKAALPVGITVGLYQAVFEKDAISRVIDFKQVYNLLDMAVYAGTFGMTCFLLSRYGLPLVNPFCQRLGGIFGVLSSGVTKQTRDGIGNVEYMNGLFHSGACLTMAAGTIWSVATTFQLAATAARTLAPLVVKTAQHLTPM